MEHVISLVNVTKVFRDFWFRPRVKAVQDLTLHIPRGQVFGLLGPNGSGKSTTIKMILGLLFHDLGQIAVLGKRPTDVSLKGRIGYLPEESHLYRFLNARETLDFYGRLFHLGSAERARRIDSLLEMVGLEGAQYRPVGEYSKGMQRRIGLAQALINDPDLLILDEPTTGMDPLGTLQIKDLILQLKKRGKTVILCTHLLNEVEDVCDELVIMYGGKIRSQGTLDQLLTVQQSTLIETDELPEDTVDRIRALVTAGGRQIRHVERPRRRLEAVFLDVVRQARASGAQTSGAASGGQLAAFLAPESDPDALLRDLARIDTPLPTPAPAPAPAPVADTAALADLVTPTPTPAPTPRANTPRTTATPITPAATPQPAPPPDDNTDRDILDSLTGRK